ncbi:MAG TPA: EscU/YscU/HrcU family type III secretion system export apparatus switch protein [Acidiphilium sp.]|jgi:flagellar biosynthetic protein FlhB|uniref:EscU/YscU/HrcU family type III secretion system export apparatus switch protein n=1 Tax=unclassified Acidiphilium TaxID=2617493 RepID=UPI000BD7352F|nr:MULTISPECIES: EscU/YscU/HrcU family type III secretion system export apparatus switch protein [unclassified Acidiphilium]OYV57109.1 MAG: type III secretion protein [Acidiphilium sp. 20-67-58]HQT60721.1 EscU/YscU/HrcU family type III secretion system export apparatus switch protein [Acidiphilium sp.]HQU10201.1 EscU/YscU/HrcU family type III secretion system export apparatus switch protein [Acidiphilium sp.]
MDEDKESKTEAATPIRLSKALDGHGQGTSREVASLAGLVVAFAFTSSRLPDSADHLVTVLASLFTRAATMDAGASLGRATSDVAMAAAGIVLPLAATMVLAAAIVTLFQTGLRLNTSALGLSFARLNPMTGLTRMFGAQSLGFSAQTILKLVAIGVALYIVMVDRLRGIETLLVGSDMTLVRAIFGSIVAMLGAVVVIQAIAGGIDFVLTRRRFADSVKMTQQEIKDEQKEMEGDPRIKARIKAAQNALAKRSLQAAMARAAVVVTNPTHYAVALEYQPGQAEAPKIVAKGVDEQAARIRDLARDARIPIVPNPPLARALFQQELESEILPEHYRTVAEIIAYIWRLAEKQTQRI